MEKARSGLVGIGTLTLIVLFLSLGSPSSSLRAAPFADPLGDLRLDGAFHQRWRPMAKEDRRVRAFLKAYDALHVDLRREQSTSSFVEATPPGGGEAARVHVVQARSNMYMLYFLDRFFAAFASAAEVTRSYPRAADEALKQRLRKRSGSFEWVVLRRRKYRWKTGDAGPSDRGRECHGAWVLYSNPRAGRAFAHRLGHYALVWLELPADRGEAAFEDLLGELASSLRFRKQICDFYEPFNLYLPLYSFVVTPFEDERGFPSVKATMKAEFYASLVLGQGLKALFHVPRRNGLDDKSFPSGHSLAAFAAAGSVGHVHPGSRLPMLLLSGMVGRSRIRSHHHRPLDVLVGGALGYYTGRYFGRKQMENSSTGAALMTPLLNLRF